MVDTSGAPATVEALIFDRLTEADLPGPVADIVVAALLGDEDLGAALGSQGWQRPSMPQATPIGTVPRFFLRSVVVEGFRGIGAKATLRVEPSPGLTLVVGRNGSGKSSFAEAAELAVTGESQRWSHNTAARNGWRNVHTGGTSRVAVGLAADGQAGMMTLAREWAPGAALEDATAYFQEPGARREPGVPIGWAEPLELYRPFLSYSELGTLVDGKPSEMYDTLQAILGLDQLIDAENRLTGARKHLDEMSKTARQALPDLLSRLSQGELHALGLALFLPRATSPDSPFRFLLIDDPVQSMDPAKVDGLARVLSQIARSRQVIVFTHDDRLAEAVRRLQIPATMWKVARRENSAVELKKNDDPVLCYLDDARALARTRDLPEEARAVVVAGFCRSALEAACHETIRNRRISAGARHSDIEQALVRAQTLHQIVALALFDDASRGDQVLSSLRTRYGATAINAFNAAKAGPHTAHNGNLVGFVEDTARLAEQLRS